MSAPLTKVEMERRERATEAPPEWREKWFHEAHAEILRERAAREKAEAERDRAEEALKASIAAMDELGDLRDERDKLREETHQRLNEAQALVSEEGNRADEAVAEVSKLRGLLERCREYVVAAGPGPDEHTWDGFRATLLLRDLDAALGAAEKEDPRG